MKDPLQLNEKVRTAFTSGDLLPQVGTKLSDKILRDCPWLVQKRNILSSPALTNPSRSAQIAAIGFCRKHSLEYYSFCYDSTSWAVSYRSTMVVPVQNTREPFVSPLQCETPEAVFKVATAVVGAEWASSTAPHPRSQTFTVPSKLELVMVPSSEKATDKTRLACLRNKLVDETRREKHHTQ